MIAVITLIVLLGSDKPWTDDQVSGPLSRVLTWAAMGFMTVRAG